MYLPAYVTSRIVPGMVVVRYGGWYQPSDVQTALMPDGVDIGGACEACKLNEASSSCLNGLGLTRAIQISFYRFYWSSFVCRNRNGSARMVQSEIKR